MIGDEQSFSKDFEDQLRNKGCQVHRIIGNGTSIATQLETI
jgi:putative cell wall-binding protein